MTFNDRRVITEDGELYEGIGFGSRDTRVCELVFNTSMGVIRR